MSNEEKVEGEAVEETPAEETPSEEVAAPDDDTNEEGE